MHPPVAILQKKKKENNFLNLPTSDISLSPSVKTVDYPLACSLVRPSVDFPTILPKSISRNLNDTERILERGEGGNSKGN